jgi:hypothetical protein
MREMPQQSRLAAIIRSLTEPAERTVAPSIECPESNSRQKNETAPTFAILVAIRAAIVILLICKLSLLLKIVSFALFRVPAMSEAVAAHFDYWHCRLIEGRYGARTTSTIFRRTAPGHGVTGTRRRQICLLQIAGDNRARRSIYSFGTRSDQLDRSVLQWLV